MSRYYGESEGNLRQVFEEATENAPAIVFIDELDAIAPKREDTKGEVERRVVAQLLALMDGLKGRGQVVVIGATNIPDAIDPALRRGGRFDREIVIGIPDTKGREEIFKIHTRGVPLSSDIVENDRIKAYAATTHGFVGADIALLVKEAAMHALRRVLPSVPADEQIPAEVLDRLEVTDDDFTDARKYVEPSGMREVLVEVPDVTWADVGGLEEVKAELQETVEWPLTYADVFESSGPRPRAGSSSTARPARARPCSRRPSRTSRTRTSSRSRAPAPLEVGRRIREGHPRDLQARAPGGTGDHLLRRGGRTGAGPRRGPGLEPRDRVRAQPDPDRDGRARGPQGRGRDGRDQPARHRGPGPAPRRTARPARVRAAAG